MEEKEIQKDLIDIKEGLQQLSKMMALLLNHVIDDDPDKDEVDSIELVEKEEKLELPNIKEKYLSYWG